MMSNLCDLQLKCVTIGAIRSTFFAQVDETLYSYWTPTEPLGVPCKTSPFQSARWKSKRGLAITGGLFQVKPKKETLISTASPLGKLSHRLTSPRRFWNTQYNQIPSTIIRNSLCSVVTTWTQVRHTQLIRISSKEK